MTEDRFIDTAGASEKEDSYSFRIIVMDHFKRIVRLASVEFRGGYWQTRIHKLASGVTLNEKYYVPDTREEYCNAITVFYDLLYPHLDKDCANKCKEIEKQVATKRDEFLKRVETKEKEILTDEYYKGTERVLLQEYKVDKLRHYRKILRNLLIFLKSVDYFESSGMEE
jgi:hypothetical protein